MIGLRTGDGHEIFVTSQVGSLSGSGSKVQVLVSQVQAPGVPNWNRQTRARQRWQHQRGSAGEE